MNTGSIDLWHTLTDPGQLFGHFTYVLMTLSVLMRSIAWLRALAVVAGLAKIVYRVFIVFDPVSIFWEALFVVINVVQLLIIWWENRAPKFTAEEKQFLAVVAPGIPGPAAKALVRSGKWRDVEPGTHLAREGEHMLGLIFVSKGTIGIERSGQAIGTCSAGDFIGEMTYSSRDKATASAVATSAARILDFERKSLETVEEQRPVLRLALQASFNRNLINKLLRAHPATVPLAQTA